MAGTEVSTLIRSSTVARKNAWTSNAGMMTDGAAHHLGDEELAVAARHMEHRHRDQVADLDVVGEADHAAAGLAVGEEVLLGGHRALREARGAARVEDRGEVVVAEVVDDGGLAVRQRGAGLEDDDALRSRMTT